MRKGPKMFWGAMLAAALGWALVLLCAGCVGKGLTGGTAGAASLRSATRAGLGPRLEWGPTNMQVSQACDGMSSRPSTNWWVVYGSSNLAQWRVVTNVLVPPVGIKLDQAQYFYTLRQSNSVLGIIFPEPPPPSP